MPSRPISVNVMGVSMKCIRSGFYEHSRQSFIIMTGPVGVFVSCRWDRTNDEWAIEVVFYFINDAFNSQTCMSFNCCIKCIIGSQIHSDDVSIIFSVHVLYSGSHITHFGTGINHCCAPYLDIIHVVLNHQWLLVLVFRLRVYNFRY